MSATDRVIVLVPSEQDLHDPAYRDKYWPNFVHNVTEAIRKQDVNCRIIVGGAAKTALLLLLLPAFASAQARPDLRLPTTVYAGAAALDLWSTADCLSVGCHERNPTISWLEPHGTAPMLAVGVALESAGYLALTHLIAPHHPRLATATIYGAALAHGFLGVRNLQQARGQRICNRQAWGTRC